MVRLFSDKVQKLLKRFGTIGSAVVFIGVIFLVNVWCFIWCLVTVLIGSIGGIVIGLIAEYYTGGAPVKKIIKVEKLDRQLL